MEFKENTDYTGQDILVVIKKQKDPKVLVKTSKKSVFYQDGDKVRYTAFKNASFYDVTNPKHYNKGKYGKTLIEQEFVFGGHMSSPPKDCKRLENVFTDKRTGITWIDLSTCTMACKDKKCKTWKEFRKKKK